VFFGLLPGETWRILAEAARKNRYSKVGEQVEYSKTPV
jgi:hypothetical protein